MASAAYGSLPFAEQIAFFRQKVSVPTSAWTDVYATEHNHAFMVAGARGEVLADLRAAVDRFIAEGRTIEEFRQEFDDIVARTGWAYNGGRNWRTRIIYETNLRQSYHAGREAQMADPTLRKARPYGLYRHGGSAEPRPDHLAWDGIVLPLDDPWWDTHTPQNGWGCTCKKFTLSARDVKRMGLKVLDQAPPVEWEERTVGTRGPSPRTVRVPKGIDPGFEYRPGIGRIEAMTPRPAGSSHLPAVGPTRITDPLPRPRPAPSDRRIQRNTEEEYIEAFLAEFGASPGSPVYYRDKAGDLLLISDQLFRQRGTGKLKVLKRGREQDVLLLADTIKDPDEILIQEVEIGPGIISMQKVYLAQFTVEGEADPLLAVFETGRWGWVGVTAYGPDSINKLLKNREKGVRLYRRSEE
ncbi:MAG: hypothetical protein D6717_13170 [Gammaproteobacteria bacterium]|nr:MAG: hypothetical protein D6717_13170 [Gammaproteobacteria bacterium]